MSFLGESYLIYNFVREAFKGQLRSRIYGSIIWQFVIPRYQTQRSGRRKTNKYYPHPSFRYYFDCFAIYWNIMLAAAAQPDVLANYSVGKKLGEGGFSVVSLNTFWINIIRWFSNYLSTISRLKQILFTKTYFSYHLLYSLIQQQINRYVGQHTSLLEKL